MAAAGGHPLRGWLHARPPRVGPAGAPLKVAAQHAPHQQRLRAEPARLAAAAAAAVGSRCCACRRRSRDCLAVERGHEGGVDAVVRVQLLHVPAQLHADLRAEAHRWTTLSRVGAMQAAPAGRLPCACRGRACARVPAAHPLRRRAPLRVHVHVAAELRCIQHLAQLRPSVVLGARRVGAGSGGGGGGRRGDSARRGANMPQDGSVAAAAAAVGCNATTFCAGRQLLQTPGATPCRTFRPAGGRPPRSAAPAPHRPPGPGTCWGAGHELGSILTRCRAEQKSLQGQRGRGLTGSPHPAPRRASRGAAPGHGCRQSPPRTLSCAAAAERPSWRGSRECPLAGCRNRAALVANGIWVIGDRCHAARNAIRAPMAAGALTTATLAGASSFGLIGPRERPPRPLAALVRCRRPPASAQPAPLRAPQPASPRCPGALSLTGLQSTQLTCRRPLRPAGWRPAPGPARPPAWGAPPPARPA